MLMSPVTQEVHGERPTRQRDILAHFSELHLYLVTGLVTLSEVNPLNVLTPNK